MDTDLRMRVDELERTIRSDRHAGLTPLCVVGNIGTVNTGTIDPLDDLVRVARREGVWLHLDGAFGAFAYLLPELRPLVSAMNRADSIVFDLHKWFGMPFDASCLLTRDPHVLESAFSVGSPYTSKTDRGPAASAISFADRGVEQSRPFRALKVWFSLQALGVEAFEASMRANLEQIRHLDERVTASPELEVVSRSQLNILCFRYVGRGVDPSRLNDINQSLLGRLQSSGVAVPSHTIIDDRFVIRVADNNHRTTCADFDVLVDSVIALGDTIVSEESG